MVHIVMAVTALCLGTLGLIGASVATWLPEWKVTAFIRINITNIIMKISWEGLWMKCMLFYSFGNTHMKCQAYDSVQYLSPELQVAQVLMSCSLPLAGVGLLVGLLGMCCGPRIRDNRQVKSNMLITASTMLCLASVCVFVPVSWMSYIATKDSYNPLLNGEQHIKLGDALYIGWATVGLLLASGFMFVGSRVTIEPPARNMLLPQGCELIRCQHATHGSSLTGYQPVPGESTRASTQPVVFSHVSPSEETTPHHPSLLHHQSPLNTSLQLTSLTHHFSLPHLREGSNTLTCNPMFLSYSSSAQPQSRTIDCAEEHI